jgi:hypothetical protein
LASFFSMKKSGSALISRSGIGAFWIMKNQ